METNARLMAAMAQYDGVRFLFKAWEQDRFLQTLERIYAAVLDECGGDVAVCDKYVKVKVLRHETSKDGGLKSVALYGPAARAVPRLNFRLAELLSEVHVKCWMVEQFEGAHNALADAAYTNVARIAANLSFFGNKPRKGNAKSSGNKGVRVGSRKSDKHAVVYKRVGERTGVETRVKDRTLKKAVAATQEQMSDIGRADDHEMSWTALRMKVGTVGYAALIKSLGEAGIELADFFREVGSSPQPDHPEVALILRPATQGLSTEADEG